MGNKLSTVDPTVESKYTFSDAIQLITDIGGYDPKTEVTDLLKKSANSDIDFNDLLELRINQHIPTAYITNHAKFMGLDLFIDERVLIPRTETEPLVEAAIDELSQGITVADVGTGSGAVALSLKKRRPDLDITGLDISKDALDVAAINSATLELNVNWKDADLLSGVKQEFGAVLANMPYLPTTKRSCYEPEMVDHEPQVALWGGEDGYDLIRRLLAQVQARKGVEFLALEIGLGQETDVCELVRSHGFPTVFCTLDRKQNIRCVVGKR